MAHRTRVLPLLLAALALVVCVATPAAAWWSKGHMAVALIAQRRTDPALVQKVNAVAKVLSLSGPYPKSPDMVQLAPWADDLRTAGLNTMSTWHFITTPYYPDSNFTLAVSPVQTVNVATVIPMLQSAIKNAIATTETIVHSLALLIHFMGDVHQPLHNANMFSNQYPDSDLGGNRQRVTVDSNGTKMTLHAYWDSMGEGPAGTDAPRPLSAEDYTALNEFVDYLESTYASTLTTAEKNLQNSTSISLEGFKLAVESAYPGAENGATLSDEYKANVKSITERRVLLAGYRLARMLNTTLPSVSMPVILEGLKNIQADAPTIDNTTYVHNFEEKGLSAGVTAGIAIALFIGGVIISTCVVLFLVRRQQVYRGYETCELTAPDA